MRVIARSLREEMPTRDECAWAEAEMNLIRNPKMHVTSLSVACENSNSVLPAYARLVSAI